MRRNSLHLIYLAANIVSIIETISVLNREGLLSITAVQKIEVDIVKFGVARRSNSINLYEIKEISCNFAVTEWYLHLADRRSGLDLTMMEYQHDRRMWDLVYSGILHSVAAGAKLDEVTIKKLELDQVPELYNPKGTAEDHEDSADEQPTWARRVDRP